MLKDSAPPAVEKNKVSNRNQTAMDTIEIETSVRFGPDRPVCLARPPLQPTEQLLLEGGDVRIALEPNRATNRYGCSPLPDPTLVAFGSSTASTISPAGFAAANRLRQKLQQAAGSASRVQICTTEAGRIRRELVSLCELADMPGLDVVLAASGTDLHLIAAQLAAGSDAMPGLVIMMDAEETGRGVPAALAGRHFSTRSALGKTITEGAAIAGAGAIELVTVPLRSGDGAPRPTAAVDGEVENLVRAALGLQRRVLLILVDGSKTGMIAPSPGCVAALRRQMPEAFEVLVDACQFRIAPATLRAYLAHDFMVAVTGSKFVTGPTFAGALFIPQSTARRLRTRALPAALSAYSARADWPASWPTAGILDDTANFGLLLRWEAALQELRAFRALPAAAVQRFLDQFALAIQKRLAGHPLFEALPVPPLERGPLAGTEGWDRVPSIFPFLLFHRGNGTVKRPLGRDETMQVYQLLQADLTDRPDLDLTGVNPESAAMRCQLGQPVPCGLRDGVPVSALRICASTRLIVEAVAQDGGRAVIERALAVLDKTALILALTNKA